MIKPSQIRYILQMIKVQLISTVFIFPLIASAQKDFRPGFIISNDGDTIRGMINNREHKQMMWHCDFRPANRLVATEQNPFTIKGYGIDGDKFFQTKSIGSHKVFMQQLIDGELDVYYYFDRYGSPLYAIEKKGMPLVRLPYNEKIVKNSDGHYRLQKSRLHFQLLKLYTADIEGFESNISDAEPNHRNLIRTAKKYHETICPQCPDYTIYGRQNRFLRVLGEVSGGVINYAKEFEKLDGKSGISRIEFGLDVLLWFPVLSERWFLKSGIMFQEASVLTTSDGSMSPTFSSSQFWHRIPVHLQYMIPSRKLSPVFTAGWTFLIADIPYTAHVGTGLAIKLNRHLYLNPYASFDFTPIVNLFELNPYFDNGKLLFYSFGMRAIINFNEKIGFSTHLN